MGLGAVLVGGGEGAVAEAAEMAALAAGMAGGEVMEEKNEWSLGVGKAFMTVAYARRIRAVVVLVRFVFLIISCINHHYS